MSNVGQGETRFNDGIYKSSHNSYARDESLASQIDDYNIWQLEFDVYDYQGDFKVHHECTNLVSLSEAPTLPDLLKAMVNESVTWHSRVTIIYLDLKGNGQEANCYVDWGDDINQRLKDTFLECLGENIYRSRTFIGADNCFWPSWQNLVSRGFNWIVVVDWHNLRPENAINDDVFFEACEPDLDHPLPLDNINTVLASTNGGSSDNYTASAPYFFGDRWFWRVYPGVDRCADMIDGYWDQSLRNKFTLIATNCVNRGVTMQSPTHSPAPLFVDEAAIVNCPVENEGCEWGTHSFPFHNLAAAIERASPMVPLLIKAGVYPLRAAGATFMINKPLILRAVGGTVRIQ